MISKFQKKDDFVRSILMTRVDVMRDVIYFCKDTDVSRTTPHNHSSTVCDSGAREYSVGGEKVYCIIVFILIFYTNVSAVSQILEASILLPMQRIGPPRPYRATSLLVGSFESTAR